MQRPNLREQVREDLEALGDIATFLDVHTATEAGYRMPRELTMVSKALLNVDQVARELDPTFDPNDAIRRQAAQLMHERMLKIANRITIGLILAAMIVGAALLMRVETSFRILGHPGLAIRFFLAAAVTGVVLVANIVVHDMRAEKARVRVQATQRGGDTEISD